ncbi:MAG: heavy metal translocating P-type ATPase [Patescibacteria group bacterium]
MHPNVEQGRPGMCPECGMNLVPVKQKKKETADHNAHDKHAGHKTESFLRKFWVVLALTVPILAYSELFEKAFGLTAPEFSGSEFVILGFGSVVFFYGGWIFLASAWRELKARLPGMMTLIALAIIAAYSFSVFAVLTGREHNLLWELSTLIGIMLLGHWVEMRAVQGAQGALKELAKLLPDTAEVLRGGASQIIPIAMLKIGDIVLVKPGGKIPADGKIIEGRSDVNESIITGESRPVPKKTNDEVIAGSINGDGALKIAVAKIGESTFLSGVMRLVADAQASKSRLQVLSDRAAFYLTVIAVALGGITFTVWLFAEAGIVFATERLVAVLVVACPHALGLAIPLVASISTTMAARNGLLIRQRLALEVARKINIVLFDKTGTLTKGEFGIDSIIVNPERGRSTVSGESEDEIFQLAASVNSHSEHPIAKAMAEEAKKKNIKLLEIKNFQRIPGKGVRAEVGGGEVIVGSVSLAKELGLKFTEEIREKTGKLARQGKTINVVIKEGKIIGVIALADVIREESREAIKSLKELGVKIAMVTGDSEDVAKWVSEELEIDEYFAKVLPHEKSEKVKLLQSKGDMVAMVGDGVNDAPALTQADLGIAIGAGTNVAIESAGIILVKSDPRDIPKIIRLSKLTYSKMLQNLFWATGYNVAAIPLAAGVLAFKGIILEPALAAALMSVSTVIVAINAVLLRRQKI